MKGQDIWTVIRHPGRGEDDEWHTIFARRGGDATEDAARKVFERKAGRIRNGLIVLARNGRIVDHAAPAWLRTFLKILQSQSKGIGIDVRCLAVPKVEQ